MAFDNTQATGTSAGGNVTKSYTKDPTCCGQKYGHLISMLGKTGRQRNQNVTTENFSRLLADHFIDKKELIWGCLKTLISITDAYAAHYCSGTV